MVYETTEVPVARSQEAIKKMVMGNGGAGVSFICNPPMEGFEALMPIDGVTYRIRIAATVPEGTQDVNSRLRQIWRVLYYHLKSVFEASRSGVMEFRELMLPYIVVKDGHTIGEHILPNLAKDVESRPERLLTFGNFGEE